MKNLYSVSITHFVIRLCYVLLAAAVVLFPLFMRVQDGSPFYFVMLAQHGKYLIFPFYAVVPAGYAALICLDKIMINSGQMYAIMDVSSKKRLPIFMPFYWPT